MLQTSKLEKKSGSTQGSCSSWSKWNTTYNSRFTGEGPDLHPSRTFALCSLCCFCQLSGICFSVSCDAFYLPFGNYSFTVF